MEFFKKGKQINFTNTPSIYFKVGWADVALASHFMLLAALKPEMFEKVVLNAFDDSAIKDWWNRMEKYRGDAPPSQ
jgi:hypothetical protein